MIQPQQSSTVAVVAHLRSVKVHGDDLVGAANAQHVGD